MYDSTPRATQPDIRESTAWAPLVFSRTRDIDFRFLAMPEDLTSDEQDWLRTAQLGATIAYMNRDYQSPIWSCFKRGYNVPGGRWLSVIGVTCWCALLSDDYNRDIGGRSIYGFFGAVCRDSSIRVPPLDLELFKPLYTFAIERFADTVDNAQLYRKSYEWRWPRLLTIAPSAMRLNANPTSLQLHPQSSGQVLWAAAAAAPAPVSLSLNLIRPREALERAIQDATIQGSEESALLTRKPPEPLMPPDPMQHAPIPRRASGPLWDDPQRPQSLSPRPPKPGIVKKVGSYFQGVGSHFTDKFSRKKPEPNSSVVRRQGNRAQLSKLPEKIDNNVLGVKKISPGSVPPQNDIFSLDRPAPSAVPPPSKPTAENPKLQPKSLPKRDEDESGIDFTG